MLAWLERYDQYADAMFRVPVEGESWEAVGPHEVDCVPDPDA